MKTIEIIKQLENGNHLSPSELKQAEGLINKLQAEIESRKPRKIDFTRVNNDNQRNPRYVCHFLELLTEEEKKPSGISGVSTQYQTALKKARKIGGKKFHNKQYGGGIVFGSIYNLERLNEQILNLKK